MWEGRVGAADDFQLNEYKPVPERLARLPGRQYVQQEGKNLELSSHEGKPHGAPPIPRRRVSGDPGLLEDPGHDPTPGAREEGVEGGAERALAGTKK